ncbi:MAG TPA: hypothetical protein VEK57_03900 [Thermoanaerobaculia bacterium]|nr:hypothetical protein [Thermoanaerobaculia bacterium]
MTQFSRILLLLSALFGVPAFGETPQLWMMPVAPTVDTPITFYFQGSCHNVEAVKRDGSVITIEMTFGPCSPPRTDPMIVPLPEGTLPSGEYRADVVIVHASGATEPVLVESLTFVVRPDPNDAPIRVHPSAALTIGGAIVRISPSQPSDDTDFCPTAQCRVAIGGIQMPASYDADGIFVIAPPHAAGLVDVHLIAANGQEYPAPDSLYYFAPGDDPPMPSVFERVLFPLLFDTTGAGGTQWRTETSIANPNPYTIDNYNNIQPLVCVTFPCGERISPHAYGKFNGGEYAHGVALLVPRGEASALSFQSRVRDISHDEDSFGSEVPVVRERDMVRGGDATLLDVPLDPRYRARLRVYAFAEGDGEISGATLNIDPHGPDPSFSDDVILRRECDGDCSATPYYVEMNLRSLGVGSRANISITTARASDFRWMSWAFVSVTNNKTQQVTIVSSDGTGGGGQP